MHIFIHFLLLTFLCFGSTSKSPLNPKTERRTYDSRSLASGSQTKKVYESNPDNIHHLIIMNSYQDVIDSVSFRVPYLKKFIHFYLRKIERLIPEYLKKSLDKQIETLKKHRINSNFTKFTTYEVIFLELIQDFISDLLSNSIEDDASERGFYQYNERIREVLKSEVDAMNLEIISDLEKVQNNRNTEGYKNTKKDAIKFVSDLQDNHIFKKIFIQRIFKILEEGFKSFWIENLKSLKFESEKKI
ncbi:hypothetical protein CWI36_0250p0030 [Hamiltosporidium magnivora]|uniref:Uncharacterized protein n=1 Tax=Hamiltosporidium magnivora TaxID=148818 RepID=A0A4Q9LII4_9MICR|nr:hypothetical protein CWI36_0250p0030 [Hamiltosporidium magnivora]